MTTSTLIGTTIIDIPVCCADGFVNNERLLRRFTRCQIVLEWFHDRNRYNCRVRMARAYCRFRDFLTRQSDARLEIGRRYHRPHGIARQRCLLGAILILVFEGSITIAFSLLRPVMPPDVLDAISLVGGVLILCVGWSIFWNEKKIRVANLLPSLVVAVVWTLAKGGI